MSKPEAGHHVVMMGRRYAEDWERRRYSVPDGVLLGWKPYTVIVQSRGCLAVTAFHSTRALRRWMGSGFRVRLVSRMAGMRYGRIEVAS